MRSGRRMQDWLIQRFPADKAESPIEALFFAAYELLRGHLMVPAPPVVVLHQQAELGPYRADFVFHCKDEAGNVKRLVVEVDGHDFHECTKDQASRDKARDRWMTEQGIQVMRFTGSDVWQNPFAVCSEVADRIHMLVHGQSQKEARAKAGMAAIRRALGLE